MSVHYSGDVYASGIKLGSGSQNFHGWWGKTVYYVDYDYGSDANNGKEATKAFKNLATALSTATKGDTIYIRPRDCADKAGGNSSYITPAAAANWTVPYTSEGLSIIGTSPCSGEARAYHTYLRGHASAADAAVLKVRAPFVNIENLSFHRGVATTAELWLYHYGDTSDYGYACSVYNCLFRLASGASSTAGTGLKIDGAFWTDVRECYFDRCMNGIGIYSNWQEPDDIHIQGCTFVGQASERSCDIYATAVDNIDISNCRFPNTIPTGGTNKYIVFFVGSTGQVADCTFGYDNDATGGFTANGVIFTHCYGGDTIFTQ